MLAFTNHHFHPKSKQRFGLFLLAAIFVLSWISGSVMAQTQFEINTDSSNLEQEYKEELDKWMLRAYEGDREAQFKVGVLFTNNQFDPPDFEQAVYWYKQAARQGHILAQYNLGHQYLQGVGVTANERTAMQWWAQAAQQDHQLAQFNLGRAYYLGIGVHEDHAQSKYWFERAAFNKEPKSIEILQQLGWYNGEITELPKVPEVSKQNSIASQTETDNQIEMPAFTSRITPIDNRANEPTATETAEQENIALEDAGSTQNNSTTDTAGSKTATDLIAAQEPVTTANESTSAPTSASKDVIKNPVALYTNPAVRSVLIAIIDERNTLSIAQAGNDWSAIKSSVGFPVWVHGDFLQVNGSKGTITGEAVNARSVPIVTNGTVVGKLKQRERVDVLEKRKKWYRIVAPTRFIAWVKTEDFNSVNKSVAKRISKTNSWVSSQRRAPLIQAASTQNIENDNQWLFRQSPSSYTLQLASFDDLEKVAEFIRRAKFQDNPELHRFVSGGTNIKWTYFLYGSYPEKDMAEAAKNSIKQKLAWVRTFGRLQQNRCVAWKTQLPTPKELNQYCLK